MDGLAGSISIISAMTMFVVALAKGQFNSAYMSITLVGSILAFLRYNRHPARVFMGDSGANFLGFILAIIALEGAFKQATALSILVPVLALGVPIFDNIFVIFRRFQSGKRNVCKANCVIYMHTKWMFKLSIIINNYDNIISIDCL